MKIDSKDIKDYGCTLIWENTTSVSYNLSSVLKYPKRTTVQFRNWAEQDGIDPDLTEFKTEPKKVSLMFLMEANSADTFWTQFRALFADVSNHGYRTFDLDEFGTFQYRYDTTSTYKVPVPFNQGRNMTVFTLDFIEDNPTFSGTFSPIGGINLTGQMTINDIDLGSFGCHVENGTDDLLKYPAAKNPFSDGSKVDLSTIRLQHKTVTLSLWQVAKTKAEFLRNHAALWHHLSRTGEQELYFNNVGRTGFYYNDCTAYTLYQFSDGHCGAKFNLSITIPVWTWAEGGGSIYVYALWDDVFGFITDEQGKILTLE
jgi:hypothetical protein